MALRRPSPRRAFRALAALALLAALCPAAVRAATLTGRVVDAASHRPVDGVQVRVLEVARAQRTGADGAFAFTGLAPGPYTLATHHVAYADLERAVRVTGGDSLVIALQAALYPAAEVVVLSTRTGAALHATPYAAGALGDAALRASHAVTPSEAAARLPGLALSRDGEWATAVSIRGLGRSNVVALVDAARIETSTDISGGLSLVNPNDLERIEVMKSSGAVLFGSGALGGAVQMVTRRADFSDATRTSGEWSEGVSSADRGVEHYAAGEHTGASHALRLSFGARNAANARTPGGVLPNSQFRDWSASGSLALRTFGAQTLTALYQRVQAVDVGIPGGASFAASAKATYRLARRDMEGLEYRVPNARASLPLLTARLTRQEIARNVEVVQSPTLFLTPHATHVTWSGQLEARVLPAREHLLLVGGELWHRAVDSRRERHFWTRDSLIGERPIPKVAYMTGGAYAQDEWSVVPGRLRAVLGGRWDRSRTQNDAALQPVYVIRRGVPMSPVPRQFLLWPPVTNYDQSWNANAGLHWSATNALALSALVASAFRSPTPEERYQYLALGGTSGPQVGNPALSPERSVSLNLGAELAAGGTRLRADAFGNRLTDLVAYVPGRFEGAPAIVATNIGSARLYGWELAGSQRIARGISLSASAACARGEDTRTHANLTQVAPPTGHGDLSADVRGAATVSITCDAAATQGQPGPGETRTPGWATWGAGVRTAALHAGTSTLTLRAGVTNAFDRAYRLHLNTLRGTIRLEPGRGGYLSATLAF